MINSVSILLTTRCNLRCAHCLVRAGENGKEEVFTGAFLQNIVAGAVKHNLKFAGISGGEPVLHKSLLQLVCESFKAKKIPIIVATNGYWAFSLRAAKTLIKTMQNWGIIKIILSTDEYHQKWIPLQYVINAAEAAHQCGISAEIHVTAGNKGSVNIYRKLQNERRIRAHARDAHAGMCINVYLSPLETAGRARDHLTVDTSCFNLQLFSCLKVENPLILPSGKVVACCDLLAAPEYHPEIGSPLFLGNIHDEEFGTLLNRAEKNTCLSLLKRHGPDGILKMISAKLAENSAEPPGEQGCKLCYWLFGTGERANQTLSFFRH